MVGNEVSAAVGPNTDIPNTSKRTLEQVPFSDYAAVVQFEPHQ
jgi:hypothetical protein